MFWSCRCNLDGFLSCFCQSEKFSYPLPLGSGNDLYGAACDWLYPGLCPQTPDPHWFWMLFRLLAWALFTRFPSIILSHGTPWDDGMLLNQSQTKLAPAITCLVQVYCYLLILRECNGVAVIHGSQETFECMYMFALFTQFLALFIEFNHRVLLWSLI